MFKYRRTRAIAIQARYFYSWACGLPSAVDEKWQFHEETNLNVTRMPETTSKDGTLIVYEKAGSGPALILVNGALAHRKFNGEKDLASRLSKNFTVIYYDRRGRGDSSDTSPYAVEREIEDLEALVHVAGGKVFLYGSSSGAALALLAA